MNNNNTSIGKCCLGKAPAIIILLFGIPVPGILFTLIHLINWSIAIQAKFEINVIFSIISSI